MDVNAPDANGVKVKVLWWTHDPRQHGMLGSYDRVLTAITEAFGRHRSEEGQKQAA